MNFTIHLSLFGVLAVTLVAVYLYRHWLENHEDHYIHLHNDQHDDSVITSQTSIGRRMQAIDKLKNGLMAATIAYALAIAAMGIYWAWTSSTISN
jgi:hypothetical protein